MIAWTKIRWYDCTPSPALQFSGIDYRFKINGSNPIERVALRFAALTSYLKANQAANLERRHLKDPATYSSISERHWCSMPSHLYRSLSVAKDLHCGKCIAILDTIVHKLATQTHCDACSKQPFIKTPSL